MLHPLPVVYPLAASLTHCHTVPISASAAASLARYVCHATKVRFIASPAATRLGAADSGVPTDGIVPPQRGGLDGESKARATDAATVARAIGLHLLLPKNVRLLRRPHRRQKERAMKIQYELSVWRKIYSTNSHQETQLFTVIFAANPWQSFKGIWGKGDKCDVDGESVPGLETDPSAGEGVTYDYRF